MTELNINDVLATSYLLAKLPPAATISDSAVLFIDIQHLASPDYLQDKAISAGLPKDDVINALADYKVRFEKAVAQCAKVLSATRHHKIPPIHIKIQSLCPNARDTGALHRRMGWEFPASNKATEFLMPTQPLDNEIVVTKTASGAFAGTGLDTTLRNMGVKNLFLCGFVTDECVETTARVALDLGYNVKIISDATTTYHASSYEYVIQKFTGYGFTQSTHDIIEDFENMA